MPTALKFAAALLLAATMSACGTTPSAATVPAALALPQHAQALDRGVARKLLSTPVDGGSRIWGLTYASTTAQVRTAGRYDCDSYTPGHVFVSEHNGENVICRELVGWDVHWTQAKGVGDFETLGHHKPKESGSTLYWTGDERFDYVVPDGMFLVIHEMAGQLSINDMPMKATERTVDYLFSDGERVIFSMMPDAWVAGVVCDPELAVPGARAKKAKSAK
jgi:hypothetical protein